MLKKISASTIVLILIGVVTLWHPSSSSKTPLQKVFSLITTAKPAKEIGINSADIIEATNKERVAAGLPPLAISAKLNSSAALKVDDMISRQYFEHTSPTGEGVSDLGARVGYDYVVMGENLALGSFTSADDIVAAWMASPGHKANILNTRYQDIGVSVKQGMYEGKEVWFAVQHFGTSRVVCPPIDASLKSTIDTMNTELKDEEGSINIIKKSLEAPGASSQSSYKSTIELFNKSVDAYNAKLATSRSEIDIYNKQVRDFNKCIATFQ
jgi:uncharacterized protein YkwD